MQGGGEEELLFAASWLLGTSHRSPASLCQLGVRHMLLSPGCSQPKSPTCMNSFPNFLLPDARGEGFLRGGSLGVNAPPATKSSDGGGHWPWGSWLLCGAGTNCARSCLDPQSRARTMPFRSHLPPEPSTAEQAVPKILAVHAGLYWPVQRELPGPRQTKGEK